MGIKRIVSLGLVSVFLVCGVASSTSPVAATPEVAHADPTGPFALDRGVRIELAAVSDDLSNRSWKPDGTPLNEWLDRTLLKHIRQDSKFGVDNPDRTRSFLVRIVGVPEGDSPSVALKNHGIALPFTYAHPEDYGQSAKDGSGDCGTASWLSGISRKMREKQAVDLEVGLALGPWKTISGYKNHGGEFVLDQGSGTIPFISRAALREICFVSSGFTVEQVGDSFRVFVISTLTVRHAFRVVALDKAGKNWNASERKPKESHDNLFIGRVADVDRIELQIRDYTWSEFKNVRLDPG